MTWLYNDVPIESRSIPPGSIGFIYEIENLKNGKKYIGKKNFFQTKKLKRKGKRSVRKVVESDWKTYFSSCRELLEDVQLLGQFYFRRRILKFCYSKGDLSYEELREQMNRNVLKMPDYYNSYVGARVNKNHLPQG